MNKTDKALTMRLADAMHNERHLNVAETRYWCEQYKQIAIEALKDEALEALIRKADMNPVMQGRCYVMHPEALQAVIDEAIKQALEQPAQDGKQALAQPAQPAQDGRTLRDYFAGQALASVNLGIGVTDAFYSSTAKHCYALADAMLKARDT